MTPREAQWRLRAKKLVQCARDAQFEMTAKTVRYMALMAILTPEENADLSQRLRNYMAAEVALRRSMKAEKLAEEGR